MSKKNKNQNEEFLEYNEDDDFSEYDFDLEEGVEESRRSRRQAKEKRKNGEKSVADTYQADFDDGDELPNNNIKVKSNRPKRDAKQIKKEKKQQKKMAVAATVEQKNSDDKNTEGKKVKKEKKPKTLKQKFFTILCSILCIYAVFVLAFIGITYFGGADDWEDIPATPTNIVKKVAEKTKEVVVGKVPDRTVVLLMVTDEDKTRTDTLLLANYDHINKKLTMMSIPRDTIVQVSDEMYVKLRSEFPEPGKPQMKINAIHHYGAGNGVEYLLTEIERMFGVKPDYYVKVDFEGFNYIVNSIGGVDFDVPQDMDYEDPTQDLYIHLKKGMQHLDGDKAQQLVRFRKDNYGGGYADGDMGRILVQQAFITTLMNKALSSDAIFKNVFSYMNAFNKYVITNATINDMARYATVLKSINMSNVETLTLPGKPAYLYGISGYEVDVDKANTMIYNVFKKPLSEIQQEIKAQESISNVEKSTDKKIQVLNGGYTDGMATEIQQRFEKIGVPVANIGTYNGEKQQNTKIITSREGIGLDLVSCFDSVADVVVDADKTTSAGYDIVVIIGIGEPKTRSNMPDYVSGSGNIPNTINVLGSSGGGSGSSSSNNNYSYDTSNDYNDYDTDYTDYIYDDEGDDDDSYYYSEQETEADIDDNENNSENNQDTDYDTDNDNEDNSNYQDNDDDYIQQEVDTGTDNNDYVDTDTDSDVQDDYQQSDTSSENNEYDYYEEEVK